MNDAAVIAAAAVDGTVLRVSGVLDFDSVIELQAVGLQWLSDCPAAVCRLDLGGVTYSTSAGIALLLDWLRAAAAAGKTLEIQNIPADMAAIARVSGLDSILPAA
jgi:phospholipid transport system transporter-binding protein